MQQPQNYSFYSNIQQFILFFGHIKTIIYNKHVEYQINNNLNNFLFLRSKTYNISNKTRIFVV